MQFKIIQEVIAKETGCSISDISPDSRLEDLGVDSLSAITILFQLEDRLDIDIPSDDIDSIVKVSDIIDKVNELCETTE